MSERRRTQNICEENDKIFAKNVTVVKDFSTFALCLTKRQKQMKDKTLLLSKKLTLFIVVMISVLSLQAQTRQTYTQQFDSLFSNVSYNAVVSGILHDRVVDFSNIEQFNLQTSDTSSYTQFIQAYSELNRAVTKPALNQRFSSTTNVL